MTARKGEDARTASGAVPEYLVERLAAGELSPAHAEEIRRRLALEPTGFDRLDRIALSNVRILAEHPAPPIAGEVRRRLAAPAGRGGGGGARASRAPRWLWLGAPVALAAAAAALVLVGRVPGAGPRAPVSRGPSPSTDDSGDTIKGLRPALRVYRKVSSRIERLEDGQLSRVGDQLQVAYVAAGHQYGAVVSLDGAGRVTYHLPAVAGPAVRLRTDGEAALPEAYELDAAPGFERFLFVAGDAPFDTAGLADVVRGRARPPAGTVQSSFTVRKP